MRTEQKSQDPTTQTKFSLTCRIIPCSSHLGVRVKGGREVELGLSGFTLCPKEGRSPPEHWPRHRYGLWTAGWAGRNTHSSYGGTSGLPAAETTHLLFFALEQPIPRWSRQMSRAQPEEGIPLLRSQNQIPLSSCFTYHLDLARWCLVQACWKNRINRTLCFRFSLSTGNVPAQPPCCVIRSDWMRNSVRRNLPPDMTFLYLLDIFLEGPEVTSFFVRISKEQHRTGPSCVDGGTTTTAQVSRTQVLTLRAQISFPWRLRWCRPTLGLHCLALILISCKSGGFPKVVKLLCFLNFSLPLKKAALLMWL